MGNPLNTGIIHLPSGEGVHWSTVWLYTTKHSICVCEGGAPRTEALSELQDLSVQHEAKVFGDNHFKPAMLDTFLEVRKYDKSTSCNILQKLCTWAWHCLLVQGAHDGFLVSKLHCDLKPGWATWMVPFSSHFKMATPTMILMKKDIACFCGCTMCIFPPNGWISCTTPSK